MSRDLGSRTEADAGAWERRFGPDYSDDRPTLSELCDSEDYETCACDWCCWVHAVIDQEVAA